jgi:hypothetical protein
VKMDEVTIRFARAARNADVAMFYYSGHAMQFAGVNYLFPVDAQLRDEADLRRMVRVDDVVADLQQAKNLRILVLDSCRNNPLAEELKRSVGTTRAVLLQRGLAKIDSPHGMIVSYATQAGRTADDGTGRNSPYTTAFLKHIEAREEIGTIFRRISSDVYETTNRQQLPELSLSITGEFYLRGKVEIAVGPNAPGDAARADFEAAERVDTVAGWHAFLAKHPDGFHSMLARERLRKAEPKVAALPVAPILPRSMNLVLSPGNSKNIWTTSVYSFAGGGRPGPGGGLENDELKVGGWGDEYWSLIQFELQAFPQRARSATLKLYNNPGQGPSRPAPFDVYVIDEAWGWQKGDRLWWSNRPTAMRKSASIPAPRRDSWVSIDLTEVFNKWRSGAQPNFGIALLPTDTNNAFNIFRSSMYSDETYRPRVEVTFD